MKFVVGIVALVVFISGCGSDSGKTSGGAEFEQLFNATANPTPGKLLGVWAVKKNYSGGALTLDARMKIESNRFTLVNRCSGNGKTATVGASASATISDKTLKVNEAKEDKIKVDELSCSVTIPVQEYEYEVKDLKLILKKGSEPFEFDKVAD